MQSHVFVGQTKSNKNKQELQNYRGPYRTIHDHEQTYNNTEIVQDCTRQYKNVQDLTEQTRAF